MGYSSRRYFYLLRDIYSLDEDEYLKTKNELVKLLEIEEIIKKTDPFDTNIEIK